MCTHDISGRPYARMSECRTGTKLVCDGDFTCMKAGAIKTVQANNEGSLFVTCEGGEHHLDGQLDDFDANNISDALVGLYHLEDTHK